MAGARLTGPGLERPLATEAAKTAYLKRFFEKADVELQAGQIAFGATTTCVEWHGMVTVTGANGGQRKDVPFGSSSASAPAASGSSPSARCP